MTPTIAITWISYALVLLAISRWANNGNALLPGKVGVVVQAFAYMATYISAVALVGFGGLCNKYGLQMLLVAAGNVWLGTWFVYRYLAWPTRLFQRKYDARTPAQLLARAYNAPKLQVFLGAISAVLLIVYGSAVFKGAALIIAGVLPIHANTALLILVVIVGLSVMWGGLRGVLYTEALQGAIMLVGVGALLFAIFKVVGGPLAGMRQLAELAPTPEANRGFLSLSSGSEGINILSLALVTSVGIWAQPQLIQRHFALSSRKEASKVSPLAMLALVLVVGGMYFGGALSRLILGSEIANPDAVIPTLVGMLLPEAGQQIFALAVVSASLSTASGLLHIASGSLWSDVLKLPTHGEKSKMTWRFMVLCSVAFCGLFALKSSSIIAMICTTSWSLLASATLAPYLALLLWGPRLSPGTALASAVSGTLGCLAWYTIGYAQTSIKLSGMAAAGVLGMVPPILVGTLCSAVCIAPCILLKKSTIAETGEEV
ncbi:sodium:solute symporter family protein [Synergistaceae bacterium OttesenSCG-928-I11]|nr:sodium:solute symporter family protein [Synergistaceae bacterium OttesenSCG-928-I11]